MASEEGQSKSQLEEGLVENQNLYHFILCIVTKLTNRRPRNPYFFLRQSALERQDGMQGPDPANSLYEAAASSLGKRL
jgi:hypothetical protein